MISNCSHSKKKKFKVHHLQSKLKAHYYFKGGEQGAAQGSRSLFFGTQPVHTVTLKELPHQLHILMLSFKSGERKK